MEGQLPTHDEHLLLKSASERTINELVEINTEDFIAYIVASWLEEMSPRRTRNR